MLSKHRKIQMDVSELQACTVCTDRPMFFTTAAFISHGNRYHRNNQQIPLTNDKWEALKRQNNQKQTLKLQRLKQRLFKQLQVVERDLLTLEKLDGVDTRTLRITKYEIEALEQQIKEKEKEIEYSQGKQEYFNPTALQYNEDELSTGCCSHCCHIVEREIKKLIKKNIDVELSSLLSSKKVVNDNDDCFYLPSTESMEQNNEICNIKNRLAILEKKIRQHKDGDEMASSQQQYMEQSNSTFSDKLLQKLTETERRLTMYKDELHNLQERVAKKDELVSRSGQDVARLNACILENNNTNDQEKEELKRKIQLATNEQMVVRKRITELEEHLLVANEKLQAAIQNLENKTNQQKHLEETVTDKDHKLKKFRMCLENIQHENKYKQDNLERNLQVLREKIKRTEAELEEKHQLLKQAKEHNDDEMVSLQARMASLIKEKSELSAANKELRRHIEDATVQERKLKDNIARISEEYTKAVKENEESEKQIEKFKKMKQTDWTTINEQEKRMELLEEEVKRYATDMEMLQLKYDRLHQESMRLNEISQMSEDHLRSTKRDCSEKIAKVQRELVENSINFEKEKERAITELEIKYKQQLMEIKQKLGEEKEKLENGEKRLQELKIDHQQQIQQIEDKIKKREHEHKLKCHELENSTSKVRAESQSELVQLKAEKVDLTKQVSQLNDRFKAMENKLKKEQMQASTIISGLNENLRKLSAEKKESQQKMEKEIKNLQENLNEQNQLIAELRKVMDGKRKQLVAKDQELRKYCDEIKNGEKIIESHKESFANEINKYKIEKEELQRKLKESMAALRISDIKIVDLSKSVFESEEANNNAAVEHVEMVQRIKEMQNDLRMRDREKEEIERKLKEKNEALEKTHNQLKEGRNEVENDRREHEKLKSNLAEKMKEIDIMESQLTENKVLTSQLKKKRKDLETRLDQSRCKSDEMDQTMKTERDKFQQTASKLQTDLEEQRAHNKQLQVELIEKMKENQTNQSKEGKDGSNNKNSHSESVCSKHTSSSSSSSSSTSSSCSDHSKSSVIKDKPSKHSKSKTSSESSSCDRKKSSDKERDKSSAADEKSVSQSYSSGKKHSKSASKTKSGNNDEHSKNSESDGRENCKGKENSAKGRSASESKSSCTENSKSKKESKPATRKKSLSSTLVEKSAKERSVSESTSAGREDSKSKSESKPETRNKIKSSASVSNSAKAKSVSKPAGIEDSKSKSESNSTTRRKSVPSASVEEKTSNGEMMKDEGSDHAVVSGNVERIIDDEKPKNAVTSVKETVVEAFSEPSEDSSNNAPKNRGADDELADSDFEFFGITTTPQKNESSKSSSKVASDEEENIKKEISSEDESDVSFGGKLTKKTNFAQLKDDSLLLTNKCSGKIVNSDDEEDEPIPKRNWGEAFVAKLTDKDGKKFEEELAKKKLVEEEFFEEELDEGKLIEEELIEEELGEECEESVASLETSAKEIYKFENNIEAKDKEESNKEKSPKPKVCKGNGEMYEFKNSSSNLLHRNEPKNDLDDYSYGSDITAEKTSEDISDQFETDVEDLAHLPPLATKPMKKQQKKKTKKTEKEKQRQQKQVKTLPPLKGGLPLKEKLLSDLQPLKGVTHPLSGLPTPANGNAKPGDNSKVVESQKLKKKEDVPNLNGTTDKKKDDLKKKKDEQSAFQKSPKVSKNKIQSSSSLSLLGDLPLLATGESLSVVLNNGLGIDYNGNYNEDEEDVSFGDDIDKLLNDLDDSDNKQSKSKTVKMF